MPSVFRSATCQNDDAVAFEITKLLGAEFPLFAFSHCRDVVAAVSRAGGFGVLGGARFSPQSLEQELKWIDDHVDGKPYGIDILIPEHQAVRAGTSIETIAAMVPPEHRRFVENLLRSSGIEPRPSRRRAGRPPHTTANRCWRSLSSIRSA
jgi:hypothetical protein